MRGPVLTLILLCLVMTLCSCSSPGESLDRIVGKVSTPGPPRFDSPPQDVDFNDTELGRRIRQDYVNQYTSYHQQRLTIDNVAIRKYYGSYNDCVAVIISDAHSVGVPAVTYFVIDGILLIYFDSKNIPVVWKEGHFFTVWKAYELGLFARESLVDIAKKHNGNGTSSLYFEEPHDFYLDGSHAGLSAGVEEMIKEAYSKSFFDKKIFIDDVWIDTYYGTYNSSAVVLMGVKGQDKEIEERLIEIDGVIFRYNSENSIMLWSGYLRELQHVYNRGGLTYEQLTEIADYHNSLQFIGQ